MNILTINHMTKAHTDKVLFEDADFSIQDTDKIGIIGINGTGKSTLLRILAGLDETDEGEVIKGNGIVIHYLPQNPVFPKDTTLLDYVIAKNRTEENAWTVEGDVKSILNKLGFEDYNVMVDTLSGGQRKKAAIAAAIAEPCDILIMDEPTNHLNPDMILWLEEYLKTFRGAFVMVTHDRYFLDRVCNRIVEIDKGKLYGYQTNYEGYLELKAAREEMALATERKRQSILRMELEWIKRGARARSTKQKARIERYEELRDAKGPVTDGKVEISAASSRLGKQIIEVENLSKVYGDRTLFEDFSYIFLKDDRVGFVGENGCGKTTLMKMLALQSEPDTGNIVVGQTVKIGYFSQESESLDDNMRVIDYIRETAEYVKTPEGSISASMMLERFLFDSTLQYSLIGKLSGGEKRRLYLLKVLMEAPNVLILDEPTNDLDIQTLAVLEDYLDNFQGVVITVSHDRYFLDRIVRRIFAFEDGHITQYEGGYSDYLEKSGVLPSADRVKKETMPKESTGKKFRKEHEEKLKFTYKEQKEYETIEDEIAELEAKNESLEAEILKCATDFVKLNELSKEKEETEKLLEEKYDRYVYLTDLAERIEAQKNS